MPAATAPPRRPPQSRSKEKKNHPPPAWRGGLVVMLAMALSCCRPFEDEEPERLQPEVDEAPHGVREVAAEAGAHHALPSGAMDRVELLEPIQSNPNW